MFASVQLFTAALALFIAKAPTPSYQLETVNNATIDAGCDNLQVGQQLCLAIINEACEPVHVVTSNDTCTSVAENAGTTVSTMIANNPNLGSGCTLLEVGLVVCVATDVVAGV
ncbi:unnamed protein product [Peniophora sp. CBMAI 1063]|nr:unnamed protein product [Peniophora sp. CBMAI 1063]